MRTLLADLRATADAYRLSGPKFWGMIVGKAAVSTGFHAVMLFRLSSWLYRTSNVTKPLAYLVRMISTVWSGTEIHPSAKIGPGLGIVHSHKVLIGRGTVIGSRVRVCHGVSIGGDMGPTGNWSNYGCPEIGDDVFLGMDVILLGNIKIGNRAVIGAQSLVTESVPEGALVSGSPAVVRRIVDVEAHRKAQEAFIPPELRQ